VVDLKLIRYFRAAPDGVLITTRPGLNLLSAYTAPRRLIRVGQDHMNLMSYKPPLRAAIVRAYHRLDAVTVLTERDRQDYRQAVPGVRVERIPNGVPDPRLPPAALDAPVLVAAGRLLSQKGFDMLLDAFALVHARHPDWQLWIFGSGPWQKRLTARIDHLGLAGRAHLKGSTTSLDKQFAAASIFVLSSRFEGLPMVLLEAMAAGLPPVAFDCPTGPGEVLDHGTSGLLVPPTDVTAMAAGICELIEDPARRRAIGAAAHESSRTYSMAAVARRWEDLLTDLARGREQPVHANR
jgi:glycosyltransferase involved in cell wall biosynthesis